MRIIIIHVVVLVCGNDGGGKRRSPSQPTNQPIDQGAQPAEEEAMPTTSPYGMVLEAAASVSSQSWGMVAWLCRLPFFFSSPSPLKWLFIYSNLNQIFRIVLFQLAPLRPRNFRGGGCSFPPSTPFSVAVVAMMRRRRGVRGGRQGRRRRVTVMPSEIMGFLKGGSAKNSWIKGVISI